MSKKAKTPAYYIPEQNVVKDPFLDINASLFSSSKIGGGRGSHSPVSSL